MQIYYPLIALKGLSTYKWNFFITLHVPLVSYVRKLHLFELLKILSEKKSLLPFFIPSDILPSTNRDISNILFKNQW